MNDKHSRFHCHHRDIRLAATRMRGRVEGSDVAASSGGGGDGNVVARRYPLITDHAFKSIPLAILPSDWYFIRHQPHTPLRQHADSQRTSSLHGNKAIPMLQKYRAIFITFSVKVHGVGDSTNASKSPS
jgi:hypothetical protein